MQFRDLYLPGGYNSGLSAAENLRKEIKAFLERERLYNPRAAIIIYYYGNLQNISLSFQATSAPEQSRNFEEFQEGFQALYPASHTILADLNASSPFQKDYLEGENFARSLNSRTQD